jgi:hypothetical protein
MEVSGQPHAPAALSQEYHSTCVHLIIAVTVKNTYNNLTVYLHYN